MKNYLFGLIANYLNLTLGTIILLVLIPYLLRHTGAELTGVYLVLMTVANFVAVGIGWLAGAGVKLIGSADETTGKRNVQEIHWVVFLGFASYATGVLLLTILGALGAGYWWLVGASEEAIKQGRNASLLLGLYIWISYVHNADLSLMTATLRQGEANLYRALAQVFFGATAFLLLRWKQRIDLLMLAQMSGALIAAIIARLHLHMIGILHRAGWHRPDRDLVRQMFITVGGPYFLFGLAQFVLLYADVFVVGAVLGSEAVAAYVILWKIAESIGMLLGRISETLSPYLTRIEARGDFANLRSVFLQTSRLQHWLALTAGFGYMIAGPFVVSLWVGGENQPDAWWLYVLAGMALFFQVVNRHDVILHFATGCVGRLLIPHVLEVGLKLALTLALVPSLGIGAPLAAFVSVQLLGMTWFYRRAGLKVVSTDWSDWRSQVGFPAAVLLALLTFSVALIGARVMNWSWVDVVSFGLPLLIFSTSIAFWYERRLEMRPLAALSLILSKK
jgi:O-antigen/teichoic acid export membrane protein